MKVVSSHLETYSDFTYILNSNSTRRGIGAAIAFKAKIAINHSLHILVNSKQNKFVLISKGER